MCALFMWFSFGRRTVTSACSQFECWGPLFTYGTLPSEAEGPWLAFVASMRRILARDVELASVPGIVERHIAVLVDLERVLPPSELGCFMHLTLELALDMDMWPIRPISMMSFEGCRPHYRVHASPRSKFPPATYKHMQLTC